MPILSTIDTIIIAYLMSDSQSDCLSIAPMTSLWHFTKIDTRCETYCSIFWLEILPDDGPLVYPVGMDRHMD